MLEFYVISSWLILLLLVILVFFLLNWKDIKQGEFAYGGYVVLIGLLITFVFSAEYFMNNIKSYSNALQSIPKIEKIED